MYVDGALQASPTSVECYWCYFNKFNIEWAGGASAFNSGYMDNRLYNYSLSANEVKEHYYSNLYRYNTTTEFLTNRSNLSTKLQLYLCCMR